MVLAFLVHLNGLAMIDGRPRYVTAHADTDSAQGWRDHKAGGGVLIDVESGETIISDPDLVSTELAPETLGALWNQRLRWAQGWSQVSLRHLVSMMRAAPT